ncbi:hypothetical protein A3F66_04220 [candidate division TM6 bacterium RIFCSPHIGHO2_12_FULL_32_22]|nr:MAG: hypothetical protein A3F66_04220 [candidate division TM6 bacterium RIFCSPHIGHO2_12_FULL_32_22]
MSHSKITSKFQTTIPKDIRKKLNLKVGDLVNFSAQNGIIIIHKIENNNGYLKSLESTLSEWNSEENP